MDDPPFFPLFWLPFLAYINVIRLMNIREQFKFGKISRRASQEVKNSVRRGTVRIEVRFRKAYVAIRLENDSMMNRFDYRIWPQIPESYPSMDSIKEIIKYLKYIFNFGAVSLYFLKDNLVDVRELITFIKGEHLEIRCSVIHGKGLNEEVYLYLLRECHDSFIIHLISPPANENFRTDVSEFPKFCNKHVIIGESKWVTVKHLEECFMDCKELEICYTRFTPEDLNSFLKRWIQGSKIKYASIDLKKTRDFRSIVQGITAIPIRGAQNKKSMILTTNFSLDTTIESEEEFKKRFKSLSDNDYEIDDDEKTVDGNSDDDYDISDESDYTVDVSSDESEEDGSDEEESEEEPEEEDTDQDTDGESDSNE
ncbi:hypothetical protein CAEBREN_08087 [Caenorhabditis brenneri]|uniref:Sdz-33 F-box domain-containing protein n=1 Tax=Caenorhabditis brenneri TaxID=135651 RepID=G0N5Y9_CAEBE|nr:hypothetical protein CAEBREN_08087 [Caenorhabditis brenneri]